MTTIDSILTALKCSASAKEPLEPYWETSLATLEEGAIEFLQREFIRENFDYARMDPKLFPRVVAVAEQIEADPTLRLLIWHGYRRLAFHPDSGSFADWPTLEQPLGADANVFYFLIALAAVPLMRQAYAAAGVPEEIVRNGCAVVGAQLRGLVNITGMPQGSTRRSLSWQRHHLAARIVRLGRMEWLQRGFQGHVHVYRHRDEGTVIALSAGGMQVDEDGYFTWPQEGGDEAAAWTTQLDFTATTVSGFPIDPSGVVRRDRISIQRAQWEHRLSPGVPCMDMHIPAGGAMTMEACAESLQMAAEFFPRYFSHWGARDFSCTSWILNPGLQSILPASANLCRLQRQVYLFPHPTTADNGMYFIFGGETVPQQLPANANHLQRAIWQSIQSGKRWRGGGMFLLQPDLHLFGQEPYLSNTFPLQK